MLFDFGNNVFESKKERNFYAKYLAGYYFNELVPGWEQRLQHFCATLSNRATVNNPLNPQHPEHTNVVMASNTTHVTFDCHTTQLGIDIDYGEFADIFLHDPIGQILVCIEAKFLDDWNVGKDIVKNLRRRDAIQEHLHGSRIISCLLIKQGKLDEGQRINHPQAQYPIWQQNYSDRVVIITWEDLLALPNHNVSVSQWLTLAIHKDDWAYGFNNNQIVRPAP